MSLADRINRSLFVGLAVGLAWGIRGDFGHLVGAMYPGAVLAMALAYVSGQRSLFLWMPVIAGASAMAIGSGGMMSYGILHGYAQSDTLVNYSYGFLTLFLQGSAWGTFGGGLIGLLLERTRWHTGEWLGLIGSVLFAGWIGSFLVVNVLGFQINPPRQWLDRVHGRRNRAIDLAGLEQQAGRVARRRPRVRRLRARNGSRATAGQRCQCAPGRARLHDQSLERDGDVVRLHRGLYLLLRHGRPRLPNHRSTKTSRSPRFSRSFIRLASSRSGTGSTAFNRPVSFPSGPRP